MVSHRFSDQVDRVSGKAKEWTGRAVGNSRLQRQGQVQSLAARVKIKTRGTAKKVITMFQKRLANRRSR